MVRSGRDALGEDATLRRILRNTGWLTGSSGVNILLATAQGVLTARLLGIVTWGVLAVALGFVSVVGQLLSFRMNNFVVKWVTQLTEQEQGLAPTAFKLAIAGDVGTAILSFIIVEAAAGWGAVVFAKSPDLVWVFRIVAFNALLQAGRDSFTGMLQVNRDFRVQGIVQVACQAASTTGVAVVFVAGGGIAGVVFVIVGVQALSAVLYGVYGLRAARSVLGAGWIRSPVRHLGEIGRDMMHFAIMVNISATLRTTMNDGDLLILGLLTSPTQVAYYKLAKSICQISALPMMPMVNASFPEFSIAAARRDWGGFRRLMRRGERVAALWVIPVSLGLAAVSPFAIRLLYGSSFVPAATALAVLLVGLCIDGILFWTGAASLSIGEHGYVTRVNLTATLAKLALAFVLVPTGGYVMLASLQSLNVMGSNLFIARRVFARIRLNESSTTD